MTFVDKNILIIGAARSGKTTLAKKFVKEKGYSMISLDNIISGLSAYPDLNIHHDGDEFDTALRLAPFLEKFFTELSEGNAFYDGVKFVIEGTHVDFEKLIPFLRSDKFKDKYEILGLTYNDISSDDLYNNMKSFDTEDDWTYWCSDEELSGNSSYFIERNKFFNEKFKEYGIVSYDTSRDREEVLNNIINSIE